MSIFEGPEKKFQRHIADFLIREHGFAVLTQNEITDTEFYFAEDHLYTFLKATQSETLERLEVDYGSDSRDEIFKALREEISRRPLWSIIRTGLIVRGHDFKLYFAITRTPNSDTPPKVQVVELNRGLAAPVALISVLTASALIPGRPHPG